MNETPIPTQAEVDALFPNETENNGFIKKKQFKSILRESTKQSICFMFSITQSTRRI